MKIIRILVLIYPFSRNNIVLRFNFSQLSIYPRYQRLFIHFLNIQCASMPLEVIKSS